MIDYLVKLWTYAGPAGQLTSIVAITLFVLGLLFNKFKRRTDSSTHNQVKSIGTSSSAMNQTGSGTMNVHHGDVHNRDPADVKLIDWLTGQVDSSKQTVEQKEAQVRELTQTVQNLRMIADSSGSLAKKAKHALNKLAQNQRGADIILANDLKAITENYERQRSHDDLIVAQLYRGQGALAFNNDTKAAINYYQRATELDPDNVDGWNQLGHLQRRIGELDQAISSYQKVGILATERQHKAMYYGNLGNIYQTRGELDKARVSWQASKKLFQRIGATHMVEKVDTWLDSLDGV